MLWGEFDIARSVGTVVLSRQAVIRAVRGESGDVPVFVDVRNRQHAQRRARSDAPYQPCRRLMPLIPWFIHRVRRLTLSFKRICWIWNVIASEVHGRPKLPKGGAIPLSGIAPPLCCPS